ncbi:hypothetical protein STEG23_029686 [Scotinomys teguina]
MAESAGKERGRQELCIYSFIEMGKENERENITLSDSAEDELDSEEEEDLEEAVAVRAGKDQENPIWIPERLMCFKRHEDPDPDTSDKPDSSPDKSWTGDAVVGSDQNVADPDANHKGDRRLSHIKENGELFNATLPEAAVYVQPPFVFLLTNAIPIDNLVDCFKDLCLLAECWNGTWTLTVIVKVPTFVPILVKADPKTFPILTLLRECRDFGITAAIVAAIALSAASAVMATVAMTNQIQTAQTINTVVEQTSAVMETQHRINKHLISSIVAANQRMDLLQTQVEELFGLDEFQDLLTSLKKMQPHLLLILYLKGILRLLQHTEGMDKADNGYQQNSRNGEELQIFVKQGPLSWEGKEQEEELQEDGSMTTDGSDEHDNLTTERTPASSTNRGLLKQVVIDHETCLLPLVDTAGLDEYDFLRDQSIRTGNGFLVVFSFKDVSTFEVIHRFREKIKTLKDSDVVLMVLVGNKCDMEAPAVDSHQARDCALCYNCANVKTLTVTRHSVEEAFFEIVREIR